MPLDPETEALRQRSNALVKDADATEAKAAAARHHVQAVRLLLEEEHAASTDLAKKAATAKGLLQSSSSTSTTSDMVDGAAYDSARHQPPCLGNNDTKRSPIGEHRAGHYVLQLRHLA
jgi:hypothetical protein